MIVKYKRKCYSSQIQIFSPTKGFYVYAIIKVGNYLKAF